MALETAFGWLTGAQADELEKGEARNGAVHVVSLALTKTGDALIDPKLVLTWLLSALGAPGALIGLLVPVREAGALLPQLAMARLVEKNRLRKRFWAAGAAVQGLSALAIAAVALLFTGSAAGWTVLALLAVFAVGRAAASISYKDALAHTIGRQRRGAVSGFAASAASAVAFAVGAAMAVGVFTGAARSIAFIVAAAGLAFLAGAATFLALREPEAEAAGDGRDSWRALVAPIRDDPQLRLFVASRIALAATALATPFIVMISTAEKRSALDQLGPLVMASTAASVLASYVWGRLSDASSRKTLVAAGLIGGALFLVLGVAGLMTGGIGGVFGATAAVFVARTAYEGVRQGRKLHLTDMAKDTLRARYTALSNTLVGIALLAAGLFGVIADRFGPAVVLLLFSAMSVLGALLALGLDEVQRRG